MKNYYKALNKITNTNINEIPIKTNNLYINMINYIKDVARQALKENEFKPYMVYNKENCTLELHTKDDVQVFGLENEDITRNTRLL